MAAAANNPAGRLHEVLSQYEGARSKSQGQALRSIWKQVLGHNDLPANLARVAALLPQVMDAAKAYEEDTGDDLPLKTVRHHLNEWAMPMLFPPLGASQGITAQNPAKVSEEAMLALGMLASTLSISQAEGKSVPEEDRRSLRQELDGIIAQIRKDPDLDPKLKSLILQRLHDIGTALDHYEVMGPAGLVAACERIIASLWINVPKGDEAAKQRLRPILAFAGKVYALVAFVGASGEAAQALESAAKALGIGS